MFVQVMEMKTSRFADIEGLYDAWRKATEGQRTLRREIVARDRNDPTRHVVIAFFDSYEDAMKNSELPATGDVATKMAALCDAPVIFLDLEVLEDR